MKKLLVIFILLFCLLGCSNLNKEDLTTYEEMSHILIDASDYITSSNYYDISISYVTQDVSYGNYLNSNEDNKEGSFSSKETRFYIVIDNPQIAMYDVKAIAFEEGFNSSEQFAPNIGVFDSKVNLVPNQINADNGFVKGITLSGTYANSDPTILCLVQWINKDNSKVYREYFKFVK